MKKRTNRLLSVLLALVMVLGLLPALGTTALAVEDYDFYLEVGDNAFDTPEMKSIISDLTNGKATGLGVYRTLPAHYSGWSDETEYYVKATSVDEDIISNEGLAKRPGECVLTIGHYVARNSSELLRHVGVKICVTNARIDRVAVTGIDAPITGQPLDMTAECSTPGIASATVEWYNSTDGVDVVSGAVAQGGKAYSAFVTVTPASGYELVGYSTTKVTVNGGSASPVYGGTDYLTVAYHFPATGNEYSFDNQNQATVKTLVSEVAITDVVIPVDGAKPVETCKLGGTGYTLKSMSWHDGSLKMNSAGTFQAGKTYRACFYLLPEKGYTFRSADNMTATVNGKTVEVTNVYGEPEQRGVTIDFTCEKPSKTISTVTVTGIDAPVIGAKPDTNAVVSTGMTAGRVTWSPADPVFKEGVAYTVTVTVLEEDGYTFGSAVTATINGQTARYSRTRQAAKLFVSTVSYTFPALKSGEISNVAVTGIDAPVFGKTPDKSAVVPADAQYTVAAVSWDPACDSFLGNSVYSVLVSLESKDGMKFATVPAVTINGETAKVVSGAGSEELKVSYIFPKTPAAYDLITNTYSTTDVTATLKEYVAVSVYTDLPDMAKNIKYQWYKTASNNYGTGTAISGATAAGYAIPTEAEGAMYYYCVVTASVDGKTVTSDSSDSPLIKVTVKKGLPAITAQPKSVTVKPGADVTFSVAATGEALNYQWWRETKSGASKVGTNGPTYTIKAVNIPDDNGTAYYCVVSNKAGEVTSDKAKLTVSELGAMTAFSDVPEGAYYTDAVAWAVEKGVTSGTSGTTFSPNADCTRAQIVTFLWRAAGSPAPKSKESSFADVAADAYYSDAVRWAVENGITSGTSATTFSPNATCTRAQTVTFLWRSQKSPADGAANAFTDVAEGTYYTDAVKWAVKNGITSGTGTNTFSPNADCSRAQIVTFLHRCMAK